jgi:hypothetical protein
MIETERRERGREGRIEEEKREMEERKVKENFRCRGGKFNVLMFKPTPFNR